MKKKMEKRELMEWGFWFSIGATVGFSISYAIVQAILGTINTMLQVASMLGYGG